MVELLLCCNGLLAMPLKALKNPVVKGAHMSSPDL
jgi:hypothetical protein